MQSSLSAALLWIGFFVTTVWGHIGFKLAIRHSDPWDVLRDIFSGHGMLAVMSWFLSAGFWALIISRQDVISATTVANLRYPLICLAAIFCLGETLQFTQLIGAGIILMGLFVFSYSQ